MDPFYGFSWIFTIIPIIYFSIFVFILWLTIRFEKAHEEMTKGISRIEKNFEANMMIPFYKGYEKIESQKICG